MDFLKSFFGGKAPWKSLTFWGVVLISGVPAALAQFMGVDLDAHALTQLTAPNLSPGDRVASILAILGIRRAVK